MTQVILTLIQEPCRCCCMKYQGNDNNLYYVNRDKTSIYLTPCHDLNPQIINGNFKII